LGVLGRKTFPDRQTVARMIFLQLKHRAARERLVRETGPTTTRQQAQKLLCDYFNAYLAWDMSHGWHGLWGWNGWTLGDFASQPAFALVCGRLAKSLGDSRATEASLAEIARTLSAHYPPEPVEKGCLAPLKNGLLAAMPVDSLAQKAKATASVTPDPRRYPPSAANDGLLGTLYWPGALVQDNHEWLQLTWDKPQTIAKVVVRFLQHPSMHGRTIHLQRETAPGKWEDFATTKVPAHSGPHAVATFQLPSPTSVDKLRVVNLLDLFEIEVR
jgi:hypothetical protein